MGNILCVDDVPDNLKLLAAELSDAGHVVSVAGSGVEALAAVAKQRPDLIILDVLMPEMSGLDVLRSLRKRHTQAELPVLMATIVDDESRIVEALRLGANDYVVKPLEVDVVLARVATQLRMVELHRERDELYRYKEELLTIAVHDLRQPLSAILATAELAFTDLEEQDEHPTLANDLRDISDAARSMGALLDGLLDLRLFENGQLRLELSEVDMANFAAHAVGQARKAAEPKGIHIMLDCNAQGALVLADRVRLSQVTSNLLGNAVKYSFPDSLIFTRVRADGTWIHFEVCDQGPGFPEEQSDRLFRKFSRLTSKPTAHERSTGLGLYITKTLVEAHGGIVQARNNPGGGATFSFVLPQRASGGSM